MCKLLSTRCAVAVALLKQNEVTFSELKTIAGKIEANNPSLHVDITKNGLASAAATNPGLFTIEEAECKIRRTDESLSTRKNMRYIISYNFTKAEWEKLCKDISKDSEKK